MLIAHASDLTGDDAAAFLHAAALAQNGARLVTIHAGPGGSALSPSASELAARWGRPIDHELRRVEIEDDVSESVIEPLQQLRPDLVVVGTHARHGLVAWLRGSVGEAIARNLAVPVLVVPNQSRGFVDPRTGELDLRKILVPAGSVDDARRGVEAARRLAWIAGAAAVDSGLEIVHAGPGGEDLARFGVAVTRIEGSLEYGMLDAARARNACLIVMPTRGHDGLGDVLIGSHTERVIREIGCPLLSVPA